MSAKAYITVLTLGENESDGIGSCGAQYMTFKARAAE